MAAPTAFGALGAFAGVTCASWASPPAKPERTRRLGDPSYDLEKISAPAATGALLRAIAWVLADSPWGALLRRWLINKKENGSALLQDLAAQACQPPSCGVAYQPMVRLPEAQWRQHAAAAEASSGLQLLQRGFGVDTAPRLFSTVEDYAKAYRQGGCTPVAAMERFLEEVERLQQFRPFVTLMKDDVRAQASASLARFKSSAPRGIFEGVPVAFKDMFQIRGYPMTQGSVWPKGDPHNKAAEQDCNVVRLFREAGAIIVGSTAMTEFGVTPLGYSLHAKGPFNAYNAQHYPLGSSSGSAVAVALGLVPVAVGADGGGSIRIPAAGEGVFGLACTYGRIPDDSDSSTLGTMQKCGPLAASARDAALAYALMAPQVPNFYSQLYGEFPGLPHVHLKDFLSSNLQGLRLGVFWEHFNDAEPQVVESCKKALDALRAAGAEIVEITIPHLKSLQLAHAVTISVEFAAISGHLMHNQHQLEPSTRIQFGLGVSFSGVEVQSANIMRGWALNHIRTIFKEQKISAIVSPTLGVMPPAMPPGAKDAGESDSALILQMMKYIFLANLCGFPAMSVPVGYDEVTKIPVGFHFMSDHWDEAVLLRLAHAVEVHHLKRERPKDFAKILA